jgi:hypothetical protein
VCVPTIDLELAYEVCQVVLDRPRDGDPHALVYLAERPFAEGRNVIAASPAFRPDVDQESHAAALASVLGQLESAGWERVQAAKPSGIRISYRRPVRGD